MLKNTLLKKKSILFAGAALIVTLGIGIITMSGAKFTADVDTGIRTITAGVLKPLDYEIFEEGGSVPLENTDINNLFTNIYPGWTKSIEVEVKRNDLTTLNSDWAPLLGGTFTSGTPSELDDRIVISVSNISGDFTPVGAINNKSLADLSASAGLYNDKALTTAKYLKLGSGKLLSGSTTATRFKLTLSFKDADAGVSTFEGMKTYASDEGDNQYIGKTATFKLVLKAVVLD